MFERVIFIIGLLVTLAGLLLSFIVGIDFWNNEEAALVASAAKQTGMAIMVAAIGLRVLE